MERALAGYQQATGYAVAEVTTAATFEMAELYRRLGKDLMKSERPANLDDEELEQYVPPARGTGLSRSRKKRSRSTK